MSGQVLDTGASLVPTAPALRLDEASVGGHASQWCSDTIGSLVRKPRQHCRRCRRLPTADVTGRAPSAARVGQGSLLFAALAPRHAHLLWAAHHAFPAVQTPLSMHAMIARLLPAGGAGPLPVGRGAGLSGPGPESVPVLPRPEQPHLPDQGAPF